MDRSFNAETTTHQVLEGIDLSGKRALVTGASGGLGAETARALSGAGAEVTLAARDTDKAELVAASIRGAQPEARVAVVHLDLTASASVGGFVSGVAPIFTSLQSLRLAPNLFRITLVLIAMNILWFIPKSSVAPPKWTPPPAAASSAGAHRTRSADASII